jgi:hypothetical protein
MSSQEEILNNFIINMEYIKENYINIYNGNPQQITVELPQIFIIHANNTLTSIDIENFTREQLLREYRLVHEVIDLFETLLKDNIFTNEEKITFSDILRLYNEKRVELEIINPNPRTGGKKSRKGKKSKKSKKSRKGKKSKKSV